MRSPAVTIWVFGCYLLALGIALLLVPNMLLGLASMPLSNEVWIRVVGVLTFNIGAIYVYAAKHEIVAIFLVSIFTRAFVFVACLTFVLLGIAKPTLVLFGTIDLIGSFWTWYALKQ